MSTEDCIEDTIDLAMPCFFNPIFTNDGVRVGLIGDGPDSPWWDKKVSPWYFAKINSGRSDEEYDAAIRVSKIIENAVVKAKSARFEFGEKG